MCLLYDKQYHFYIKDCNAGIKLEYVQTKSALLCLKEFSNRANQSKEVISYFIAIQQLLSKGINLSLHWIPGHRKTEGNKQADLAAKWQPVQTSNNTNNDTNYSIPDRRHNTADKTV